MWSLIAGLIAANILSVSSAAFHELLFEALSRISYADMLSNSPTKKQGQLENDNRKLKSKNNNLTRRNEELSKAAQAHRTKLLNARRYSDKIVRRTAKNVTLNVSSVAAESVPYIGVGLIVAVTASDVKDGCDTVKDVNEMLRALEVEGVDDQENHVCGITVPSPEAVMSELKENLGSFLHDSTERSKENAQDFYDALGGTLNEIFNSTIMNGPE